MSSPDKKSRKQVEAETESEISNDEVVMKKQVEKSNTKVSKATVKSVEKEEVKVKSEENHKVNLKIDNLVVKELKNLYKSHLLPIERQYQFNKFNHPEILDSELNAKPTVLLVGQYSTG